MSASGWCRCAAAAGVAAALALPLTSACGRGDRGRPAPSPDSTPAAAATAAVGLVAVPDVRRVSLSAAAKALARVGLGYEVVTDVNARAPDGEILAVVPDPGRRVHRGSTVTLHEAITVASVPDLDGLPIAAAERVVRRAGLTPIAQPTPNGDPSLTNRVFRQQPVAGGQVRRGTHVHVHYYSPARAPGPSPRPGTAPPTAPPATGPRTTAPPRTSPSPSPSDDRVAVPGVVGQPEQQAVAQLEAVGLDYKRITNERRGPPDGTVLAVVPPAGDRVRRGTTVTLRVAVSTVPVPDLTGVALPDAEAAVRRLGLEPQPEATPNTDPALSNEVYAQEPAARRRLRHGGQVLLRYYAPVTAPTAASPTADEPDRPSDGPDVPEATD